MKIRVKTGHKEICSVDLTSLVISPTTPRLTFSATRLWSLRTLRSVEAARARTSEMTMWDMGGRRRFHAGGDPFADERRLQFCHGANDGEHGATHGAVRKREGGGSAVLLADHCHQFWQSKRLTLSRSDVISGSRHRTQARQAQSKKGINLRRRADCR